MKNSPPADRCAWNIVVAIPVKNEADRIAACLTALSDQCAHDGREIRRFSVLLFVNNSDDETADIAAALSPTLRFQLTVSNVALPPQDASAGGARRHAMEAAAKLLEELDGPGLLMTTDADSRVSRGWIANTVAAIDAGADAVAGMITLDANDEAALPAGLKARGALEGRYEALICELETRLDPQPHDPWPRHPTESGASFALTLASFRAVGGVPNKALGEDRALAAALRMEGFRVRHAPDVNVITSGRLFGRAAGGCADTMRLRIAEPNARCDEYLRPALDILRQYYRRKGAARCTDEEKTRRLEPKHLPAQILIAQTILLAIKAGRAAREQTAKAGSRMLVGLRVPGKMLDPDMAMSSDPEAENIAPV